MASLIARRCYFKDIDGNVPDRFELISAVKVS